MSLLYKTHFRDKSNQLLKQNTRDNKERHFGEDSIWNDSHARLCVQTCRFSHQCWRMDVRGKYMRRNEGRPQGWPSLGASGSGGGEPRVSREDERKTAICRWQETQARAFGGNGMNKSIKWPRNHKGNRQSCPVMTSEIYRGGGLISALISVLCLSLLKWWVSLCDTVRDKGTVL